MFEGDKIALVGQISDVIMWVSLTVGLLIFVIGYFAGAKRSLTKILICTIVATVVGALAMRVPIAAHDFLLGKKAAQEQVTDKAAAPATAKPQQTSGGIGEEIANLLLFMIWTAFLVGMGIFLYEAMTVTADEARPN